MILTKKEYLFVMKYLNKDNPNLDHLRRAFFDKYHYNKLSLLGYYRESIRRDKLANKLIEISKIANDTVESNKFKTESLCYIGNESKTTAKVIAKKAIEQALIDQLPKCLKDPKWY